MYLDTRNNNKVTIIRDSNKAVIVKNLKDGKKYLLDKSYLKEIK
jgi:hypothetical protein